MAEKTEKTMLPPYIAYKSFSSFISGLKESGIPQQIDRSIFPTMSGSAQSAMIASLRYLNLIDDQQKPTTKLQQLVDADQEKYSTILKNVLTESYKFLLSGDIKLESASGKQVEDKFREQGTSGSTIGKCIAFFLAVAREAGIKVSPHVRPPKIVNTGIPKKKRPASRQADGDGDDDEYQDYEEEEMTDPDLETFRIPIPGKKQAVISIPKDLTKEDWDMLQAMFAAYVKRLQAQQ